MSADTVNTIYDLIAWRIVTRVPGTPFDREVCEGATCENCGHKGLRYHPYRSEYGHYIAIAECPKCKAAEEF